MRRAALATRARYNRISRFYDLFEGPMERLYFQRWRELVWGMVRGPRVLEVGVGTGKNFPYYSHGLEIVGVDLSDGMLARAQRRATKMGLGVELVQIAAEALAFPDETFDTVIATFVFCSVPDPVRGLHEVGRVCKKEGKIILLEHVLPERWPWRWLARAFNPLVVRLIGDNINRRTVENVRKAGLRVRREIDLSGPAVKLILASPSK